MPMRFARSSPASLAAVPAVVIGPRASSAASLRPRVAIDTGLAGVHDEGTALRLDDVPLPVRARRAGSAVRPRRS